jgi:hypothetical protein
MHFNVQAFIVTQAHPRQLRTVCLCLSILLGAVNFCVAAANLDTNSPFLPPGYGQQRTAPPKKPPTTNSRLQRELEFRGIVQLNGTFRFSLFHKKENKSYWIKLNESVSGIRINSFNPDNNSIVVNMGGQDESLTLMTASESPLPVPTSPQIGMPNTSKVKKPALPSELQRPKNSSNQTNRVVPRRRVILPKK